MHTHTQKKKSLATVRTLILLTDQDDKQNIMSLFQIFFDVVRYTRTSRQSETTNP